MRGHFWRADMDGVDWDAVTEQWRPVVDSLRTHDDLIDLLWEVGTELNTSHAYASPPTPPGDQERRLGLLGADVVRARGRLAHRADPAWGVVRPRRLLTAVGRGGGRPAG